MAEVIYNKDNSELDGTTETVDRDVKGRKSEHMWHMSHDLDVSVTVTFYGSHENDDAFDDGVSLGTTDLSSGGDTGFQTLTDPWEQIRVEIAYGADPTSGSITIYQNAER